MRDDLQSELLGLYERLEHCYQQRDRLAVALVIYGGALVVFAAMPVRMWKIGGGIGFYVTLGVGVLLMGLIGLWLLVKLVVNQKDIRDLKEEIAYFKDTAPHLANEKPKRRKKTSQFTIGDDGELIPAHEADDRAGQTPRQRIVL